MLHTLVEIFLWLLGLCVGSFLNVVVYRLTVGLSIAQPRRSFCPRCRASIAWYDNIPLLSWLLLGGRCRHCRTPISVGYPLLEALTGLGFILVYHLLFIDHAREGVALTALPADAPLLVAWLALVACLVACAAMDIASYAVDVRVTTLVLALGIVLHALWPRDAFLLPQAQTPTSAAAVAAFIVGALMLWWSARHHPADPSDDGLPPDAPATDLSPSEPRLARFGGGLGTVVFVLLAAWLVYATAVPRAGHPPMPNVPVAAALVAIFAVTVLAGGQQRLADEEIHAAIEEERPQARRMAWHELKWLLPAVTAAFVTYVAVASFPLFAGGWEQAVGWQPTTAFVPLAGAAVAIRGAVIAAAAGWLLRIVFTLIYGREAFGVGDIYILAAAGATAGADIALLGLLLSVGIALAGWIIGLLLKTTMLIPFGPWLAIGFVLALWWSRPAHRIAATYASGIAYAWQEQPHLLYMAVGVMLVASAAAIALSRLVRRCVEPKN
jgi:leader peptidase (prepilin peptidase)/N-methyltransferase